MCDRVEVYRRTHPANLFLWQAKTARRDGHGDGPCKDSGNLNEEGDGQREGGKAIAKGKDMKGTGAELSLSMKDAPEEDRKGSYVGKVTNEGKVENFESRIEDEKKHVGHSSARVLFDRYDVDRSGSIDKTELREMLSEKANVTDDDIDEVMRDIDKNADDRISFEEFLLISESQLVKGKQLTAVEVFFHDAYRGIFGEGDLSHWAAFVTKTLRRRAQVEAEIVLRRLFREKSPPSPYCVLACGLADDIELLRPTAETSTWKAVHEFMDRILEPAGLVKRCQSGDSKEGKGEEIGEAVETGMEASEAEREQK